jgi:hypothetical protein
MATTTLADLQTAATAADAKLRDAHARLEQARDDVIQASAAQHQAIVTSVSDQPPQQPAAPVAAKGVARAASVPVDPVAAATKRLADALAAYEQVRRELGV